MPKKAKTYAFGMAIADAQRQIRHMEAFIEQEANEKIEEIDSKAEEEFYIEKGNMIEKGIQKINVKYKKMYDAIEAKYVIYVSKLKTQARMKIQEAVSGHIHDIINIVQSRLPSIRSSKSKYVDILHRLVLEGLYQLMEEKVIIRCREDDVPVMKSILPKTLEIFSETSKMDIEVELDDTKYLPPETSGGAELLTENGKIKVRSTLEARLALITYQILPEIRISLYGVNEKRKFYN